MDETIRTAAISPLRQRREWKNRGLPITRWVRLRMVA